MGKELSITRVLPNMFIDSINVDVHSLYDNSAWNNQAPRLMIRDITFYILGEGFGYKWKAEVHPQRQEAY